MLPTPAEKLQNFFGVFLQFHIGVDTSSSLSHSVIASSTKSIGAYPPFEAPPARGREGLGIGAAARNQPNSPDSRGISVRPIRATPPPAMSCFIRFVYIGSLLQCGSTRPGELPMLSHGRRLYLHPLCAGQTASGRLALLPQGIVVGRSSVRGFAADCPLFRRLGSRHAPSMRFFRFRRRHTWIYFNPMLWHTWL